MKNLSLDSRTIRDIEGQIAKVLRGLGDPEPPVDLRLVRELLKLDRGYYSTTNDSLIPTSFAAESPASCINRRCDTEKVCASL